MYQSQRPIIPAYPIGRGKGQPIVKQTSIGLSVRHERTVPGRNEFGITIHRTHRLPLYFPVFQSARPYVGLQTRSTRAAS